MSVKNHIIKVSFCGTFQKAVKPKRSAVTNTIVIQVPTYSGIIGCKHGYFHLCILYFYCTRFKVYIYSKSPEVTEEGAYLWNPRTAPRCLPKGGRNQRGPPNLALRCSEYSGHPTDMCLTNRGLAVHS